MTDASGFRATHSQGGDSVLLSWVAVNNDPFEREGKAGTRRLVNDHPVPGPTLTLLFDEESPEAGKVTDVVLLHRQSVSAAAENDRERRAVEETVAAIRERQREVRIQLEPWAGDDPTDHRSIFEFLRVKLPELRRRYAGRELLIHVSPGTPAMHTIWVLMAETGFIEQPFRVVQTYRKQERRGRPAAVPVQLGIDTFYKVYRASRPSQVASDEQRVTWDPALFRSNRLRALFAEARRFAHLNVPVLLLGERGTGKTTLANWIRLHSLYRKEDLDGSWPAVACGQYSPETMRAELFGYKKGAFTDAKQDKPGLLDKADGDTLFLDEVGDVSRDLQRLLIKALEERQFYALGDDQPRSSRFRLLTATNLSRADLETRLDPDFLDRIGLLTLRLPALREIREELPWLWEAALQAATRRSGVEARAARLGQEHRDRIVSALVRHPLPGNLRDLFRVAYRLLAGRGDPVEPLSPQEAVEYALMALNAPTGTSLDDVPRSVARAFANQEALDGVLAAVPRLATKDVERRVKGYMAEELRRIATSRGEEVGEICDVSERTLRSWLGDPADQEPAGARKKAAERAE